MNYHTRYPIKPLFLNLCSDYSPTYDPWGNCMGLFFDVAAEVFYRHGKTPVIWRYKSGGAAPENYLSDNSFVRSRLHKLSDKRLLKLGNFCRNLAAIIENKRGSY